MKKTNVIASIALMLCVSVLFGAASPDKGNTLPFDVGALAIINKDIYNKDCYACTLHHWPEIARSGSYQQPGFVAVIMKKMRPGSATSSADPLVLCRSLALALQYNANNNMAYYISNPVSVLIQTMQDLDQEYGHARMASADRYNASIKAVAILFGERYRNANGELASTIIMAKGVKQHDQANYLPQLTEIKERDASSTPITLQLPEIYDLDFSQAPVVVWQPSKTK